MYGTYYFIIIWLLKSGQKMSLWAAVSTAIFIFATAIIAFLALLQTRKQTKITRNTERPYMSVHWVSDPESGNRIDQGVRSTCLKLQNVGRSIMHNVSYEVCVNGIGIVPTKNHSIISANSATWIVYNDNDSIVLGEGNIRKNFNPNLEYRGLVKTTRSNDVRISGFKKGAIQIKGQYYDVSGVRYSFAFSFDPNQQSWFDEQEAQKPVDS